MERAPSPTLAAKLTRGQLGAALRAARRHHVEAKAVTLQQVLRAPALRQPPVLDNAYATIVAGQAWTIAALNTQIAGLAEVMGEHFGRHPAAEIYLSQPGLGTVLASRVMGEFGDDTTRFRDARARKNYSGQSPIARASGRKTIVLARYATNRRLGATLHMQAYAALTASPGARAHYDELRARNIGHHATLTSARQQVRGDPARLPQDRHEERRGHRLATPSKSLLDKFRHGITGFGELRQVRGCNRGAVDVSSAAEYGSPTWWTRVLADEMFGLHDRVVVVTGGSRGLGREAVLACARMGADCVIASRRLETCREVADLVRCETGRRALAYALHAGRWEQCEAFVDAVYAEFGRLDVLVNNAGKSPGYDTPTSITEELFDATINLNLKGPFRLTALVGERMVAAGGGSIINVSSTGSIRPTSDILPYAAAKAGLNAITEAFAHAYGPTVRVNTIMPGPMTTEISQFWDMRRMQKVLDGLALQRPGRPQEIIGAILFLASDASSYVTGSILRVDGGTP